MTLEEAKQLLTKSELKSFKEYLKECIKYKKENQIPSKQYDLLKLKTKVTRWDELKTQLQFELDKLTVANQDSIEKLLYDNYEEGYYKTIFDAEQFQGFSSSFNGLDKQAIGKAINTKWLGDNYSSRIWKNENSLMNILNQELPRGLALGTNPRELSRQVSKRLNTNYNNTVRLVRTEYANVLNNSTLAGYKANGIDRYQILAALDERTCDDCDDFNEEIFEVKDAQEGINMPPFHPNCRCTTIPYFEKDEIDEMSNEELSDIGFITYDEWKDGLVKLENGKVVYDWKQGTSLDGVIIDELHPRVLAGAKLGNAKSLKQAQTDRINPNYDKDKSYTTNCQSCVVAYEARCRGYNVRAKPNLYKLTNNPLDYSLLNELADDMTLAYFKPGTLERPTVMEVSAGSAKAAYDKLDKLVEKGNRYEISIRWKSKDSRHIMNIYRNDNNVLEIYDPQSNEIFTGHNIRLWRLNFAETGRKHPNSSNAWPIKLLRVDNLVIDERTAQDIMEVDK